MEHKIKVAAVSYLNTIPFLYGLEQDDKLLAQLDLRLEYPSICADLLKTGEVDLALIPVAEIPNINQPIIISDYCIGAVGKVNTVMLYSHCPLNEIQSIALDYQSRTSAMLTKILVKNFWGIEVSFEQTSLGYIDTIKGSKAGLVIGDRAFDLNGTFPYEYDLAEEWFKFTGLPFVFACWVANKSLESSFVCQVSEALKVGLENKEKAILEWQQKENSSIDLKSYLNSDISYEFDDTKKLALNKFLSLASEID
jgi:chorismate dehydratase